MTPQVQLLVYAFGPEGAYEGRLVGALERLESGGALRVLDAVFVQRDAQTGALAAINLHARAGDFVAPLIGFRLDPGERRRATERALSTESTGVSGEALRAVGEALQPGAAVAAVLVEHRWAGVLEDAVARTGGTRLANEFVETTALTAEMLGPAGSARES